MPRKARIDAPGALQHIIIRGIEKKSIFRDDCDRDRFIERLGSLLFTTATPCYAWALMPNHVHLLLRTGLIPLATVMRRLLTGYAQHFNRRHKRHGHLFQNRYKSILCEEEPYLLELLRYIHLNPLRAGIVNELDELKTFQYSGHSTLMGTFSFEWQDTDYVMHYFGKRRSAARREYQKFVADGIHQGNRPDLVGGGFLRSIRGWIALEEHQRRGDYIKGDERILGSSDFVTQVLKKADEAFKQGNLLKRQGIDFYVLLVKVAKYCNVDIEEISSGTRQQKVVDARSILCYLAVRKLQLSCLAVSQELNMCSSSVSKAVIRGKTILSGMKVEGELFISELFRNVPSLSMKGDL
jgi:REP element-mobilizing transposase RayT